jgi:hypothetical protein
MAADAYHFILSVLLRSIVWSTNETRTQYFVFTLFFVVRSIGWTNTINVNYAPLNASQKLQGNDQKLRRIHESSSHTVRPLTKLNVTVTFQLLAGTARVTTKWYITFPIHFKYHSTKQINFPFL